MSQTPGCRCDGVENFIRVDTAREFSGAAAVCLICGRDITLDDVSEKGTTMIEQSSDLWGDSYTTEWACEPPAQGVPFVVERQEWSADYTVRKILEVRLV